MVPLIIAIRWILKQPTGSQPAGAAATLRVMLRFLIVPSLAIVLVLDTLILLGEAAGVK